jgi:hypothetical protein
MLKSLGGEMKTVGMTLRWTGVCESAEDAEILNDNPQSGKAKCPIYHSIYIYERLKYLYLLLEGQRAHAKVGGSGVPFLAYDGNKRCIHIIALNLILHGTRLHRII